MIAALFGVFAFVVAIGFGVLLFGLLLAKVVFGLVLLPLKLAAGALKVVFGVLMIALLIPVLAIGAPLLALAAVAALVFAPLLLIGWGVSRLLRSSPAVAAS